MKFGIIVSHHWPLRRGAVRMMVKVKVVELGRARWKPEAKEASVLTRDLVSDLAGVWGEERGGGEGVKIQGAHCFPRACITDFFP